MEDKELTLKEVLQKISEISRYLRQKWKLIFLSGIIGGAIGVCVSICTVPSYISSVKFVLDNDKNGGSSRLLGGFASSLGLNSATGMNSLFSPSNITDLLTTRSLVERTLLASMKEKGFEDLTFIEYYLEKNDVKSSWSEEEKLKNIKYLPGENRSTFSREKDSILYSVYRNLITNEDIKVKVEKDDAAFIELSVKSNDEIFAKNFCEELLDVASSYYFDMKTKNTKLNVEILEAQVDSVKRELNGSMVEAASANDQLFGLNPSQSVKRVNSTKKQLDAQINTILLQELIKNLETAKFKLMDLTPVITVIDRPIYPLDKNRLSKLKGIIIGGFIAGFLMVNFLLCRRFFKIILSNQE